MCDMFVEESDKENSYNKSSGHPVQKKMRKLYNGSDSDTSLLTVRNDSQSQSTCTDENKTNQVRKVPVHMG